MQSIAQRARKPAPDPHTEDGPTSIAPNASSPFLSLAEFGALIHVGRARANAMAAAGLIPTIRLGKRIYVPRRALERMADDALAAWEASER